MKKPLFWFFLVLLILVISVSSFALGIKIQRDRFAAQLDAAQAMLWFNHLMQFREIESDLVKGCTSEGLERVRVAIDKELDLLSSFEKKNKIEWVNKYISDRDAELLNQLKNFKSKYGNSFVEPRCKK